MKVTLSYRGQLVGAAGTASEELEVDPEATIASLVAAAAQRAGEEFSRMVFDDSGAARRTLLIAVDGEQVIDLSAPVGDNVREITLMPPIAGG